MAKSDKHAVVYFNKPQGEAMKELAKRLRAGGARTTLVWSNLFKGVDNLLGEARAVLIQRGCANAAIIEDTYRKLAHDVEIHYIDSSGEFVDQEEKQDAGGQHQDEVREDVSQTDSVVAAETIDDNEGEGETAADIVSTDDSHNFDASAAEGNDGATDPSEPVSN